MSLSSTPIYADEGPPKAVVASTANLTLDDEQTINGVAVVEGDTVLAKDQTDPAENGLYLVKDGRAWTRRPYQLASGLLVSVVGGTADSKTLWMLTAPGPITPDVTDLTFTNLTTGGGGGGGSGDFVGPGSATDNAVVRFDGTTGKLGQNSVVIISDAGAITGVASIAVSGLVDGRDVSVDGTKLDGIASGAQVCSSANVLTALASAAGAIAVNSQRITGLTDPSGAQDAATKAYVDALANGLDLKASCALASTANLTLSGEQTIDGVLTAASRILVKNQSTGANNGIYVTGAGAWTRATDADVSAEVTSGMYTFVSAGTVNGGTSWAISTADPITLGSTALVFTQIAGPGTITAGNSTVTVTGLSIVAVPSAIVTFSAVQTALAAASGSVAFNAQALTGVLSIAATAAASLPITAHATSIWQTDVGDLELRAAAAIKIGMSTATSVTIGRATATTTLNGAVAITADAASSHTTSAGALTFTAAASSTWGVTGTLTLASTTGVALQYNGTTCLATISGGVNFTGALHTFATADTDLALTGANGFMRIRGNQAAANASSDVIIAGASGVTRSAGRILSLTNNATTIVLFSYFGGLTISGASASSGGTPTWLTINSTAPLLMSSGTESNAAYFNFGQVHQYSSTTPATHRTVRIAASTVSCSAASQTINDSASLYISGAVVAGTNVTLTRTYAIWVAGGLVQFDGNCQIGASGTSIGFFGTTVAVKQTSGANLTNNVTSGGTDDTIANFTDLVVYANDAAAIRNDIYQLSRKVKQLNDGARTYGLYT